MTPLVLGLLALALAGPAPWLLTRMPRLRTVPRAAMVLWQATALAAVLAALGAGLSLATDSAFGADPTSLRRRVAVFALTTTLVVGGRLLWKGHQVGNEPAGGAPTPARPARRPGRTRSRGSGPSPRDADGLLHPGSSARASS